MGDIRHKTIAHLIILNYSQLTPKIYVYDNPLLDVATRTQTKPDIPSLLSESMKGPGIAVRFGTLPIVTVGRTLRFEQTTNVAVKSTNSKAKYLMSIWMREEKLISELVPKSVLQVTGGSVYDMIV